MGNGQLGGFKRWWRIGDSVKGARERGQTIAEDEKIIKHA